MSSRSFLNGSVERPGSSSAVTIGRADLAIDFVLVSVVTALAFGLAYHPFFFGDELILHRLAITHDYAFWPIFREINTYKPRLVGNGIVALLAKWQSARWVTCVLQVACVVWINALLYGVVRFVLRGDRVLAWLMIATVLSSRYGIAFYFDYSSGLLDLLATALLLSALLAAWLAWRGNFKWPYAIAALASAVLCVFVHERYVAGLLAAGFAIAIAEYAGSRTGRRIAVAVWASSLGLLPLLLFWTANTSIGSLPLVTGHAGLKASVDRDTFFTALTYSYDVLLGGNYGPAWYWGTYNHSHPAGRIIGPVTAVCTVALAAVIVLSRAVSRENRRLAAAVVSSAVAMIVIASLPGSTFHQARWMFPVGILLALTWIIIVRGIWRHVAVAAILATNVTYLLLQSQNSIAQVSASRSASVLAGSLLAVKPNGRNGILVVQPADTQLWSIGGCCVIDMGPRLGDTYSKVNLKSQIHINPIVAGHDIDPGQYDFALTADHYASDLSDRYRTISVAAAAAASATTGVPEKSSSAPANTVLGSRDTWPTWQWNTPPDVVDGAVSLRPGMVGSRFLAAADLNRHWLVYHARTVAGTEVPMRLQVNWHARPDNRFLSTVIDVVYPDETWRAYALFLQAPPEAALGVVFATLHNDGTQGVVEVQSIDLK